MKHTFFIFLFIQFSSLFSEDIQIPWARNSPTGGTFSFGTDYAGNDLNGFYLQIRFANPDLMEYTGVIANDNYSYAFSSYFPNYRQGLSIIEGPDPHSKSCFIYGPYKGVGAGGQEYSRDYLGTQPGYPPAVFFVTELMKAYKIDLFKNSVNPELVTPDTFLAYLPKHVWKGDPRLSNYGLPGYDAGGGFISGPPGVIGPAGLPGPEGPIGRDGDQGEPGLDGAVGPIGPAGSIGPAGPQGEAGPAGGPAGPAGLNGTDGSAGALGLSGPTGATGAIGATGATGSTGATGAAGVSGIDGIAGATGEAGATGSTGATGSSGQPGAKGADGAPGGITDLSPVVNKLDEIKTTLASDAQAPSGLTDSAGQDVVNFNDSKPLTGPSFVSNSQVSGIRGLKQTGDPSGLDISLGGVWPTAMGTAPHYAFSFSEETSSTSTLRTTVRSCLLLLLYLGFLFSSYRLLLKAL